MRLIKSVFLLGIALTWANVAYAQEGEAKLVDEVIARINSGVIMRSAYENAQRDVLEELKKQGLQGDDLEKKFKEWQPRILDELINTQLLAQRAKELSINVEPQVNQQLLRMMKENNCESLECLGQRIREAGFDIEEVKRVMTENFSKDAVLYREVYGRVFQTLTEKEKRETYEKNKQTYTDPAEVTLSRIFITFGKDPDQALAQAKDIATQARGGVEFAALAKRYSEEPIGKDGGSTGPANKISDLTPEVKAAVENAAAGTVSDPIKLEKGYYIFRVDQRKEAKTLPFEDDKVQDHVARTLVGQYGEKQIEAYLAKLRDEAFIEIDTRYQFESAKVKSAQIKHVPYTEEKEKKKKEKEKKEEKKAQEMPKTASTDKP
ncbi:MAG TPA: peptidyl-prolyl cis-trans isomerase [Blastocatellia bacterium]|nr:peptidyl-prolyl cis-trans isomerase [Blastocatellia bacterium]